MKLKKKLNGYTILNKSNCPFIKLTKTIDMVRTNNNLKEKEFFQRKLSKFQITQKKLKTPHPWAKRRSNKFSLDPNILWATEKQRKGIQEFDLKLV